MLRTFGVSKSKMLAILVAFVILVCFRVANRAAP